MTSDTYGGVREWIVKNGKNFVFICRTHLISSKSTYSPSPSSNTLGLVAAFLVCERFELGFWFVVSLLFGRCWCCPIFHADQCVLGGMPNSMRTIFNKLKPMASTTPRRKNKKQPNVFMYKTGDWISDGRARR